MSYQPEFRNEQPFQVDFFWVVTPCSVVAGYQRFRRPWFLHLQDEESWYPTTT